MTSRRIKGLLLAGAVALVAGTVLVWRGVRMASPPPGVQADLAAATLIRDEQPLPAFVLRSARGPVGNAELAGHWTFLFFGYTHCPDVCPGTLSLMTGLRAKLPEARRPAVLFVSVDPARDTPELLGQYVPAFDPSFVGATGSDEALAPLVKHLGVFYQRHEREDARNYVVDHSAAIYLIDPRGRLHALFSPPHDPAAMLSDYLRLTRG